MAKGKDVAHKNIFGQPMADKETCRHVWCHLKPSPVWGCGVCGKVEVREPKPKRRVKK